MKPLIFSSLAVITQLCIGICLNFLNMSEVHAERDDTKLRRIARGMTMGEVLALVGPPLQKEEHEAKREGVWYYPNARIQFFGSHVREFFVEPALGQGGGSMVEESASETSYRREDGKSSDSAVALSDFDESTQVKEIFDDISKEAEREVPVTGPPRMPGIP